MKGRHIVDAVLAALLVAAGFYLSKIGRSNLRGKSVLRIMSRGEDRLRMNMSRIMLKGRL